MRLDVCSTGIPELYMEEKKNCFPCCKSKLNKENSSLMSSDLGFQVVIPVYLQLLDSDSETIRSQYAKTQNIKIGLLQRTILRTSVR